MIQEAIVFTEQEKVTLRRLINSELKSLYIIEELLPGAESDSIEELENILESLG